jgi:hypothetical protein
MFVTIQDSKPPILRGVPAGLRARGLVLASDRFQIHLDATAGQRGLVADLAVAAGLLHGFLGGRDGERLLQDLGAVADTAGRHDRRRRGVVAFELGIRRVGIAERVELPFLVGRLRAAGADGRLERRLVLVEDRDDVVQRLAVAHGVVADQGIGRCRQSSLLSLGCLIRVH